MRIVLGYFRPSGWGPVPVTISVGKSELHRTAVETTPGNYVTLDLGRPARADPDGRVTLRIDSPVYRPYEVARLGRAGGLQGGRRRRRPGDGPHPRHYLYEALFERAVPELGRRLHGLPDERARDSPDLRRHLPHLPLLGRVALPLLGSAREILYPPVDVTQYAPRAERKPVILGSGTLLPRRGHAKRHDAMIRTFRRLTEEGLSGWELHLAGGSMAAGQHRRLPSASADAWRRACRSPSTSTPRSPS